MLWHLSGTLKYCLHKLKLSSKSIGKDKYFNYNAQIEYFEVILLGNYGIPDWQC